MTLLDKLGQVLTTEITTDFLFNRKNEVELGENTYLHQLQQRRTVHKLGRSINHSQAYLTELIQAAVNSCPSALNLQTTRIVILFENAHAAFWALVKDIQKTQIPEQYFAAAEIKIDQCSEAFGTVLFFEDQSVLQTLQKNSPLKADQLPTWSEHSAGMAQYAVWMALADVGVGAEFNYYNPVIDYKVAQHLELCQTWKLQTQLVFGSIEQDKIIQPVGANAAQFKVIV